MHPFPLRSSFTIAQQLCFAVPTYDKDYDLKSANQPGLSVKIQNILGHIHTETHTDAVMTTHTYMHSHTYSRTFTLAHTYSHKPHTRTCKNAHTHTLCLWTDSSLLLNVRAGTHLNGHRSKPVWERVALVACKVMGKRWRAVKGGVCLCVCVCCRICDG